MSVVEKRPNAFERALVAVRTADDQLLPTATLADALERKRREFGFTPGEFGVILGVGGKHYSELIRGTRSLSYKSARRAYALGVPAALILG